LTAIFPKANANSRVARPTPRTFKGTSILVDRVRPRPTRTPRSTPKSASSVLRIAPVNHAAAVNHAAPVNHAAQVASPRPARHGRFPGRRAFLARLGIEARAVSLAWMRVAGRRSAPGVDSCSKLRPMISPSIMARPCIFLASC
jgi:hypothetical protein